MLCLRRVIGSIRSLHRSEMLHPAIISPVRSFSKVVDNNVDGRERLAKLGDMASYSSLLILRHSYPNFHVTCSLSDFRKKWDYLKNGERDEMSKVCVAGVLHVYPIIHRKNYQQAKRWVKTVFL